MIRKKETRRNRKPRRLMPLLLVISTSLFGGCESKPANQLANSGEPEEATHVHSDGTRHADHGGEHAHAHGPHGGVVADWGGGRFHVELVVVHRKREATVYVLADDAKTSYPIDASEIFLAIRNPITAINLSAVPHTRDPEGRSSRFVGQHESLGTVKDYEGAISGVVSGVPYSGNFSEDSHHH